MVLSKRERYIGIGVGVVLLVLALDQVLITPLTDEQRELTAQLQVAQQEMAAAQGVFENSRRMARRWSRMAGQAVTRNASEAESQVLNNVRQWAQESGVNLSSQKPDRTEKQKDFMQTTFRATGTGGMSQVARFLYQIESAGIPVRITDLTVSTRKEGADELSVTLGISTIYHPPETARPARGEVQS